jgi:capsular polysaccharide biosynthesis protein
MKKQKNKKANHNSQNTDHKKNYYKKLISDHKSILAKARGLIENLLDRLQEEMNNSEVSNSISNSEEKNTDTATDTATATDTKHFLFGDKESASSIIVKLTTILLKLIPLEAQIARADLSKADILELEELSIKTQIPDEDLQIIERYIERYNEEKA